MYFHTIHNLPSYAIQFGLRKVKQTLPSLMGVLPGPEQTIIESIDQKTMMSSTLSKVAMSIWNNDCISWKVSDEADDRA